MRAASGRAGDDSSEALASRAEAERRAGRPERAREFAERALAGDAPHASAFVAHALALIDSGDLVGAHRALEHAFLALGGELQEELVAVAIDEFDSSDAEPLATLAEDELESAFEAAEAQPSEMHDANHVAAAALRLIEDGEPEGVDLASSDSPFATETIATLLESQGQPARAGAVRSAARARGRSRDARLDEVRRDQVAATLSRWLENLRRRTA